MHLFLFYTLFFPLSSICSHLQPLKLSVHFKNATSGVGVAGWIMWEVVSARTDTRIYENAGVKRWMESTPASAHGKDFPSKGPRAGNGFRGQCWLNGSKRLWKGKGQGQIKNMHTCTAKNENLIHYFKGHFSSALLCCCHDYVCSVCVRTMEWMEMKSS